MILYKARVNVPNGLYRSMIIAARSEERAKRLIINETGYEGEVGYLGVTNLFMDDCIILKSSDTL